MIRNSMALRCLTYLLLALCFMIVSAESALWFSVARAAEDESNAGFDIRNFIVEGDTLLGPELLKKTLAPFTGKKKTAADVETARDALEKLYHDAGYPAVMVNIPEQTVAKGFVKLQVLESRIGRVNVTGNRYFTEEKILRSLPSFAPGSILYLPQVQKEVALLNRNQDFKVNPQMAPGREAGTIDVEFKVEDKLPLHGSIELNNRATSDTTSLRLAGMLRYDNLWQREHSISFQYQMSPQDTSEVEVIGGSYALPAPWNPEHQMAVYAIRSQSETVVSGEGFLMSGKGTILGGRYVIPLLPYKLYAHNITIGIDYKDFEDSIGYKAESGQETHTPLTYMPLSFSYTGLIQDEWGGSTQFSAGLNMSCRSLVADTEEFANKRYQAKPNYLYATAGIQRNQKLPWGMGLFIKIDGQVADQPLVSNEQYAAGGMESVRGYKEAEAMGDNAFHLTTELFFPNPLEKLDLLKYLQITPFAFYDMAELSIYDPLPGQDRRTRLKGAGAGIRGAITKYLEYEMDWAVALEDTDRTQSGDNRINFRIKTLF